MGPRRRDAIGACIFRRLELAVCESQPVTIPRVEVHETAETRFWRDSAPERHFGRSISRFFNLFACHVNGPCHRRSLAFGVNFGCPATLEAMEHIASTHPKAGLSSPIRPSANNRDCVRPPPSSDSNPLRAESILLNIADPARHENQAVGPNGIFRVAQLPIRAATEALSFSRTTFWRFRKKHRIAVLTGRQVSVVDLWEGIAAERRGERRSACIQGKGRHP